MRARAVFVVLMLIGDSAGTELGVEAINAAEDHIRLSNGNKLIEV